MNNAVIYARVSSVGDRQDTTRQVNDLTKYAHTNALNVVRIFEEHVSGAKGVDERPVLAECLQFCIDNDIDCLLLSELSRLGRNVWNVLDNIKWCREHHLNVFFQKENLTIYDADGNESKLLPIMVSVLGMVAETERENIKFRLNSGRDQYIANGGKLGRKQGSTKTDDDILNNPKYSDVIKRLGKGQTIRDIHSCTGISIGTIQKIKNILKTK